MTLRDVEGQPTAIATLEKALRAGRVHHAYRFEGPSGVGKELAAFGLAQALLCESEDPLGCGTCEGCRRVVTLRAEGPAVPLHPDVQLVERQLYAPESIATGERKPTEKQSISIDQIRTIVLSRAEYPPVEGRARIIIIRRAEELTIEAANALLKTLEEPRQKHHFILLTAHPDELLPTIRSRTLPVRFGPLPTDVLRRLLQKTGMPEEQLDTLVEQSGGRIQAALDLADHERTAAREAFIEAMLGALRARTFEASVRLAESVSDRAELTELLGAFAARCALDGRAAAKSGEDRGALRFARAHDLVTQAILRVSDHNAGSSHVVLALTQELRALR